MKYVFALVVAAGVGSFAGPASAQMDWLSIHLDHQRDENLRQHQQRMGTPDADAPAEKPSAPVLPRVVDRNFIVYLLGQDGTPDVREGDVVPYLPREGCWAWGLRLDVDAGAVDVVETLILPEPAGTWEAYASTLYSDDGRSATNHLSLVPDDGWIGNAWCVGEGDPTGDHKIIVEIAGAVVATFDFTVEKLK